MEFILRCNDLKCRTQLHERAVVTTCSHVFCTRCTDSSGLSRAAGANRICPACGTQLMNQDDVVVAALNPSEDYKTSILSGLSPSIIMDCASRALAFYSYQASQEIVYQEHLAKSLTEKFTNLNQQMDQVIHEANTQIKALQDKVQAMQAEQAALERKNLELADAFREKAQRQQQLQKLYQNLKAQLMSSRVVNAAGDEAEMTIHNTARGDRFVNRIPGMRTGAASLGQYGAGVDGLGGDRMAGTTQRPHARQGSGSSGNERDTGNAFGFGQMWSSQGQTVQGNAARADSTGTPAGFQHRSRLPVLGGSRQTFLGSDAGPSFQPSPMTRQPLGIGARSSRVFGVGAGFKAAKRPGGAVRDV